MARSPATRPARPKLTRQALATLAVHAGAEQPAPRSPPLDIPVYRASTFRFSSAAEVARYPDPDGDLYLYSRYENPTVRAVERRLAALEGAERALAFGSGMAAITTSLLAHLSAGDALVASSALYGGVYRFLRDHAPRFGIEPRFLEPHLLAVAPWPSATRAVYVETPINPTLRVVDLKPVAARCRKEGALLFVDGTFASPLLQRPLELGADLVLHSATKILGGHSDLLAGVAAGSSKALAPVVALRRALGGVLSPDDAFQLSRSLKTLPLRVARQSATAAELARRLGRDRRVLRVHQPCLASHPDHALARRQMADFGWMLTLELRGGRAGARRFLDRLELVARAASLGGAESVASVPVDTSHAGQSPEELRRAGVTPGMVRLSVGLEDLEDLYRDLDRALGRG
ncbi:MAG: trans-sulfuration enzyme family protein [Deltaproteobacteria bacterium]